MVPKALLQKLPSTYLPTARLLPALIVYKSVLIPPVQELFLSLSFSIIVLNNLSSLNNLSLNSQLFDSLDSRAFSRHAPSFLFLLLLLFQVNMQKVFVASLFAAAAFSRVGALSVDAGDPGTS